MGAEDWECTIVLVSDRKMSELNRAFRRVKGTTDVLAFPMRERADSNFTPQILGDVVISVERAMDQARECGHSLEYELCFLLVHGLLHLLGWEDSTPAKRAEMQRAQERILGSVLALVRARWDEDRPHPLS